jgi:hypothetical protein
MKVKGKNVPVKALLRELYLANEKGQEDYASLAVQVRQEEDGHWLVILTATDREALDQFEMAIKTPGTTYVRRELATMVDTFLNLIP